MKKRIKIKRIMAGVAAFLLVVTGTLGSAPVGIYAAEIAGPSGENGAEESGAVEEFNATLGGINKYFMKLGARAFLAVTPGESLADRTTAVSFEAADGYYYLARQTPDPYAEPEKPDTAAQALDSGWIKKTGAGTYVWQNLSWNQSYDVYELNLSVSPSDMRKLGSATTGKGIVGGSVSIEGELLTGNRVKAVVEHATTEDGSWSWYTAATPGAATWTPLTDGVSGEELTIPDSAGGLYIKAVYTASSEGDFEGSIESVSGVPAASRLTGVSVSGTAAIGQSLTASVTPGACAPGVRYEWYRTAASAAEPADGQLIYTGNPYAIQAEDIGNRLYVKAVSLANSVSNGEVSGGLTDLVVAVPCETPGQPLIVETGASSLTVQLPPDSQGLYELGYSTDRDAGQSEGDPSFVIAATRTRGENPVIIPGLKPSTTYYIWARQVGEQGFTNSGWSSWVSAATLPPALTGSLIITGNCVFDQTLTAAMTQTGQNGTFHWYRDKTEIVEVDSNPSVTEGISSSYRLQKEDIGKRLTVTYTGKAEGSGSGSSGSLSAVSDLIEKTSQAAPVSSLADPDVTKTDKSLAFSVPGSGSAKLNVGYADTADGIPVLRSGSFAPGETVTITGLERNTEYYIFLRFEETEIAKESGWSAAQGPFHTEKTELSAASIEFDNPTPAPGTELKAVLRGYDGEVEGIWNWVETEPGGITVPVSYIQDVKKPGETSFMIPGGKADGTSYTVSFTGSGGMDGKVIGQSGPVTSAAAQQYPPPAAPVLNTAADTILTVSMPAETEGVYEFSYGSQADGADRKAVSNTAYGDNSIQITELNRITEYYIWAKRLAVDSSHTDSDWSSAYLTAQTGMTEIGGQVTIAGEAMNGSVLTASYEGANYLPEGDDTGGVWSWERALSAVPAGKFLINGTPGMPVYYAVDGADSSTYTLTRADINYTLKAVYSGPEAKGFTGEKSAESAVVKKTAQTPPEKAVLSCGEEAFDEVNMDLSGLTAGGYYQIRKAGAAIPQSPDSAEAAAGLGWLLADTVSMTGITKYYDPERLSYEAIEPETSYTVYMAYAGTADLQPSAVVTGDSLTSGYYKQKGTLEYSSMQDAANGILVVGGELRAELKDASNSRGTWKWYVSTSSFEAGEPAAWEQLNSGYYPTRDEPASKLTLADTMLGKYIRAEFVADTSGGYSGTVKETAGGESWYSTYVRKLYEETLKLESDTSNGKGEPRAYVGSVLTGTVENYVETGNLDTNRTVQLLANGAVMDGVSLTYSGNTFRCVLTRNREKDGQTITASISKPKRTELYVTKNAAGEYQSLDSVPLTSEASTNTKILYTDGVPISSSDDLRNFMAKSGTFAAREQDTYVVTRNIQYTGGKLMVSGTGVFNGIFDGDYHTITGLENAIMYKMGNTTVRNLIINNAQVNTTNGSNDAYSGAIIAQVTGGGTVVLERVFLSQATIYSGFDTGYFIGKVLSGGVTTMRVSECSSAGGSLKTSRGNAAIGGFIGYIQGGHKITVRNSSAIKSTVTGGSGNPMSGFMGGDQGVTYNMTNIFAASSLSGASHAQSGGVQLYYNGINETFNYRSVYYDSTISPAAVLHQYGGVERPQKGTPKPTSELIGSQMEAEFEANLTSDEQGVWTYSDGYYPRLSWLADHPVGNLFAATRGAFTSVDGLTDSEQMFNGQISGVIEVPEALQAEGYSYSSSNTSVLEVTESGRVIPVAAGKAVITIHYDDTDPTRGYQADNTYEFTVAEGAAQNAFDSVTVEGTAAIAQTIRAAVEPSTASGLTYQWYRRLEGTTNRLPISGEDQSTYTVSGKDAGYALCVEVSAEAYARTMSPFTDTIQVTAPAAPPSATAQDYQSVLVTGQGGIMEQYEFAYATGKTGTKQLIPYQSASPVSQTVNGLEANTNYWFFSRIPAGTGYSASPWSDGVSVTTGKIPLEGVVTLNDSKNVGTVLTARMADNNQQTGSWKVERIKAGVTTELTVADGVVQSGGIYDIQYTLQNTDVGAVIRFTFTADGDFTGSAQSDSQTIEKSIYPTPSSDLQLKAYTDTAVTLEPYSGNVEGDLEHWEYGYKTGNSDTIVTASEIEEITAPSAPAGIRIGGLSRNTSYSFYVRQKGDAGYETSRWGTALPVTTDRTDLASLGRTLSFNSSLPVVEDVITVSAPAGISGLTGSWGLEKVKGGQSATVSGFTAESGGLSIRYTLLPQEAGYVIRAVFTGTGDFKGKISTDMAAAVTEKKYEQPGTEAISVTGKNDSSITVKLAQGLKGSYQFGRQSAGASEITECTGSVQQGNSYTITGLERNKTYQIFVRRMEETGYLTSNWSAAVEGTTDKTDITGDIKITGTVEIAATLTAEYQGGYYAQNGGSDDSGGTYTWKSGGTVTKTEAGSQSVYEIKDADRGKELEVTYTPPTSSDFQGSKTKLAGTVAKTATDAPAVPVPSATADTGAGSTLKITNAADGAWYIPVKYDGAADTRPNLVPQEEGADAGWKKAEGTELVLTGLSVNTDYIVYGAYLETESRAASRLVVSARTRTLKEETAKGAAGSGSTGIEGPAQLKPMDENGTSCSISVYGKAPTGTWNWYAAKEAGGSDGWKIIRSEKHEEASEAAAASDTWKIPYEYSGYYLKVEFQADGDYSGQETWLSSGPAANREITGAVLVTPDNDSGNQRLFGNMTAAYQGSDDRNGTWIWYREDSAAPSGWTAVGSEFYVTAGPESSYTPSEGDIGKKLKAEYTAASFGCTGSSEAETGVLAPALQNRPAPPDIINISGTNVTLSDSDPGRAGPYGTRPDAAFGYRKASEPESEILWPDTGTLISRLEPSTEYLFYTKYKNTVLYAESGESEAANVTETGAGRFYQSNLSLTYDLTDGEDKKLNVDRTVTAVYKGEGWDKGSFSLKRSDGQEITVGFQEKREEAEETVSCSYQLPASMVGFSLIFTYTANEGSGYSGSVEIKTGAVTKPAGATPQAPTLEKHLDTDLYLTNVTEGQEYAILKAEDGGETGGPVKPEEPARYSSLWQILEADESGRWRYTGLERGTAYYVYTRTVETADQEVSAVAVSNPETTESFLYMGDLTLKNEKDLHKQPAAVSGPMEIPTTLNGNLTVESVRVLEAGESGGTAPFSATESVSEFVTDDGGGTRYLNPNVYEKGSSWANKHFATTLELSGAGGRYAELENGGQSTFDAGDTMVLSVYRANAVTLGGSYIWEITLRDDQGTEALLKAEVTIVTQLEATAPLRVGLQIKDQELLQTTNGASLKNGNGMPVEVYMSEKPGKGTDMPDLLGEPTESDPRLMDPGAVYLKLSVDNSLETGRVTDLWFNTTLAGVGTKPLVKLGASSQADYYVSGIISENGPVSWPWPEDGNRMIEEAYQLKFTYGISEEGYPVYTPKISSPEFITVSQEGGES